MKFRTTWFLLLLVCALGGFIWFYERRTESTREHEEELRKAMRFSAAKTSFLRFEAGALQVECAKEGDDWKIVQPIRARAEEGEIGRILNGLETMPRGEVVAADDWKKRGLTLADYGLDQPRARITLGDGLQRRTILVGRDAPLGRSLYIKEDGRDEIVATDTNLLTFIPQSVSGLRSRVLLDGSPEQVRRLEVRNPSGFIQALRRDNGDWMIQQPLLARADRALIRDLLDQSFGVRVEEFVSDSGAPSASYGLDDTGLQIVVTGDEKEESQTLLLGKPVEKNQEQMYARLNKEDFVYAVRTDAVARLSLKVEDLRDRRLLPLSSYDISFVRLEAGERMIVLQKKDDGGWLVTEPKQWTADTERVKDLLNQWTAARIERFIDEAGTNLAELGLAPPACRLTFSRLIASASKEGKGQIVAAGDEQMTLLINDAPRGDDSGRLLAKLDTENSVYEVSNGIYRTISLDPLFFRDREVLSLDSTNVVTITQLAGARERSIQRDGGEAAFHAVPPEAGEVDEEAVKDILMAISRLRVADYVADDPQDLVPFGLDAPRMTLTFGLAGGSGIGKTLMLGAEAKAQGIYAMIQGEDIVFVLDKYVRDRLLQDLFKIRSSPIEETVDVNTTNSPSGP